MSSGSAVLQWHMVGWGSSRAIRNALTTGLLAAAGVAAAIAALGQQGGAPPADLSTDSAPPSGLVRTGSGGAAPAEVPSPARHRATVDRTRGLFLVDSVPVRLRVPRIGVVSALVPLGLDPEGAMEVPADDAQAGWYTKAPTPGALGPSVLAAHVTWGGRPALFFRLGELRRGDRIEVDRQDGSTAVFSVQRVARFAKSRFPTDAVYGPINHAGLRLITCGGEFDASTRHYVDNVVVFAALVRSRSVGG